MKTTKRKILIYVLFIVFCLTCIVLTIAYINFHMLIETYSETKKLYHENLDEVISILRDIERDKFFKYYKYNDLNILLKQYEDLREEMNSYSTSSLLYVNVEETFKISFKYGQIPISFRIIDRVY